MTTDPNTQGRATQRPPLEDLAKRASGGDGAALAALVAGVQDEIYRLALRMLWHPEDAEDATQEVLFKIVTSVSTFRGESALMTWALRVATNHLLNIRRSRMEEQKLTFEAFGADLLEGLADNPGNEPDQAVLVEEVKIGCTQAMLLCLDRDERIAYILGDVFELRSEDAGEILEVEPATFRKRLSRARNRLREFMRAYCGLMNSEAPCSCARRVAPAIRLGRVDPSRLLFAGNGAQARRRLPVIEVIAEMEGLHDMAAIHQSHLAARAPVGVRDAVRRVLESGSLRIVK
jgi:RNA polymerase sigma factor (sigma-70 family)